MLGKKTFRSKKKWVKTRKDSWTAKILLENVTQVQLSLKIAQNEED